MDAWKAKNIKWNNRFIITATGFPVDIVKVAELVPDVLTLQRNQNFNNPKSLN